MSVLQL